MDSQSRDVVTWTLGSIMSVCVLAGLVVRFILVPYLRDHLVTPVQDVHKQVTENSHSNPSPTIPDRIDDVAVDVKALTHVMDEHLRWSDRWTDLYERRLDMLAEELERHRTNGDEEHDTHPTT